MVELAISSESIWVGLPAEPVTPPPFANICLDLKQPWPLCVPGVQDAVDALTEAKPVMFALEELTQRVVGTSSRLVQRLLTGELLDFDDRNLIAMVALRWRLLVAESIQDEWDGNIDGAALEALLAESDSTLRAATVPAKATFDVQAAYEFERQALVRAAVNLVQHGRKSQEPEVVSQALTRAVAKAAAAETTRKVTVIEAPKKARSFRSVFMMGVLVALAAGFAWSSHRSAAPALPPNDAPIAGSIATGGGAAARLIHTQDGSPFDAYALVKLKDMATAEGRTLQLLGPGEALLGPLKGRTP